MLGGTDGEDPAGRAVRVAAGIRAAAGSTPHAARVTVDPRGVHPNFMSDRQVERIEAGARGHLAAGPAFGREHAAVDTAASDVRLGRMEKRTLGAADEAEAGFVDMPNRSGDAIERVPPRDDT